LQDTRIAAEKCADVTEGRGARDDPAGRSTWQAARRLLSAPLIGAAVFLLIADLAVLPTVSNTRRSVALVGSMSTHRSSGSSALSTPKATVEPEQDTRPTVPPPPDLGSLIVNLSDLGYVRLVDAPGAGPLDLNGAVSGYRTQAAQQVRQEQLRRFGFTRGYRATWRATAGTPIVTIEILEHRTIAGAEDDLASLAAAIEASHIVSAVPVSEPDGAVAERFVVQRDGKAMQTMDLYVQRGARVYVTIMASSRLVPDPKAVAVIAARQAAVG
jgi:hypothetical protein